MIKSKILKSCSFATMVLINDIILNEVNKEEPQSVANWINFKNFVWNLFLMNFLYLKHLKRKILYFSMRLPQLPLLILFIHWQNTVSNLLYQNTWVYLLYIQTIKMDFHELFNWIRDFMVWCWFHIFVSGGFSSVQQFNQKKVKKWVYF